MANEDKGTFLTVAEVADIMRVSKMTVYRLVHAGDLPAVRVGRSFRVNDKAVQDYLNNSIYDVGESACTRSRSALLFVSRNVQVTRTMRTEGGGRCCIS